MSTAKSAPVAFYEVRRLGRFRWLVWAVPPEDVGLPVPLGEQRTERDAVLAATWDAFSRRPRPKPTTPLVRVDADGAELAP